MIRGRMVAIEGKPVDPSAYEDERTRRLAEREFNLSYGADLPPGNVVEAGAGRAAARQFSAQFSAQFSVEAGLAKTFGWRWATV